jgi:hypothetical protein
MSIWKQPGPSLYRGVPPDLSPSQGGWEHEVVCTEPLVLNMMQLNHQTSSERRTSSRYHTLEVKARRPWQPLNLNAPQRTKSVVHYAI